MSAQIYGGITVDLNDGPIRTEYNRGIDGKLRARLVIGEAWEGVGISVSRSTVATLTELEEAVAELKAWVQRQEQLKTLPEVA
ncbi:hypothetical protein ACI3K4_27865 [Streptomyces sp. CSMPJR101]|uniref:hypothetical protein n=1 Tax=Streptomyces sp. CSMPJR101 TaxID=1279378 RepID=UPI00385296AF